jgi:hypothetical protein
MEVEMKKLVYILVVFCLIFSSFVAASAQEAEPERPAPQPIPELQPKDPFITPQQTDEPVPGLNHSSRVQRPRKPMSQSNRLRLSLS